MSYKDRQSEFWRPWYDQRSQYLAGGKGVGSREAVCRELGLDSNQWRHLVVEEPSNLQSEEKRTKTEEHRSKELAFREKEEVLRNVELSPGLERAILVGITVALVINRTRGVSLGGEHQLEFEEDTRGERKRKNKWLPSIVAGGLFLSCLGGSFFVRPRVDAQGSEECQQQVTLVHTVDHSDSTRTGMTGGGTRLDGEKGAVEIMAPSFTHPQTREALVSFNQAAVLETPLTSDPEVIVSEAGRLVSEGDTDIQEGFTEAVKQFGELTVNPVILFYTDAELTPEEVSGLVGDINSAQENINGLRVFAIGVDIDTTREDYLQQIAQAGNGSWGNATTPEDLTRIVREMAATICPSPTPEPTSTPQPSVYYIYLPIGMKNHNHCDPYPANVAFVIGTSGSGEYKLINDASISALEASKRVSIGLVRMTAEDGDRFVVIAAGGTAWSFRLKADTTSQDEAVGAVNSLRIKWQSSTLVPALRKAISMGVTDIVVIDDWTEYLKSPSDMTAVIEAARVKGIEIHSVLTDVECRSDCKGYSPGYGTAEFAANQTGGVYVRLRSGSEIGDAVKRVGMDLYCWEEIPGAVGPGDNVESVNQQLPKFALPLQVTQPETKRED